MNEWITKKILIFEYYLIKSFNLINKTYYI